MRKLAPVLSVHAGLRDALAYPVDQIDREIPFFDHKPEGIWAESGYARFLEGGGEDARQGAVLLQDKSHKVIPRHLSLPEFVVHDGRLKYANVQFTCGNVVRHVIGFTVKGDIKKRSQQELIRGQDRVVVFDDQDPGLCLLRHKSVWNDVLSCENEGHSARRTRRRRAKTTRRLFSRVKKSNADRPHGVAASAVLDRHNALTTVAE